MTSKPLVSIIIPAYNRADTVQRAIDSALAQDWPETEILVVDDGSTDGTRDTVRRYEARHVRLIERQCNGGAAAARNAGIAAARGDYIAFLDSDDEFLPGKVRMQVEALRAAPEEWQLSCTSHYLHLLDQNIVVKKWLETARDDFLRMYSGCDVSPGSTLMARRDVFDRIGPLDQGLKRFEDWDWLLRYSASGGRILIVRDLLARIYNRKSRMSEDLRDSVQRFAKKIRKEYLEVDPRLQRRTVVGMWNQLYTTAMAENRLSVALNAAFHGLRTDPMAFSFNILRELNSRRLRRGTVAGPGERERQRPSVALVIHGISAGGAERVLSILANALVGRGWAVTLVVYQDADHEPFYPLSSEIDYTPIGFRNRPSSWPGRMVYRVFQLVVLRRTIRRKGSRVVLSFMDAVNVHTLLAMVGAGMPVVVAERSDPAMHRCERAIDYLRRRLYPRAAAIVVQTENAAGYFPRYMQPDIAVLPNPLPVAALRASMGAHEADRREIVAIGRLGLEKGFDILLPAFARIAAAEPDWHLAIHGDGVQRDALLALRDSLGLRGRVDLPGITGDIPAVLGAADIFVLSSRYEGFPNALLEAMACGVAVVSFDCRSGPSEIISDGEDGLLVPPENEEALADAMLALIRDPERRARLGEAAAKSVRRYDEDKVMDMWESLLRRAGGM